MTRVLVLLLLLAGCGDPQAEARAAAQRQAESELASDPGAALRTVRAAIAEHGADARLELVAGLACKSLGQTTEQLQHAEAGLAFDEPFTALRADLSWVRGSALMSRYMQLSAGDDWRAANTALEQATTDGAHRAEAATALVFLQDMGTLGSQERQLKFARLVLQLDPGGEYASKVQALLDKKGLKP